VAVVARCRNPHRRVVRVSSNDAGRPFLVIRVAMVEVLVVVMALFVSAAGLLWLLCRTAELRILYTCYP